VIGFQSKHMSVKQCPSLYTLCSILQLKHDQRFV
jgi:hypothetical protein